jgi:hypothetical protein
MANFWWHLSGHTKGFRNGGEMTRLVYFESEKRGAELAGADASARLALADTRGSVRTESAVTADAVDRLCSEVHRIAQGSGFPEEGVTPYTRPGSVLFGVYLDPATILFSFAAAITIGEKLTQLGRGWRQSRALKILRNSSPFRLI